MDAPVLELRNVHVRLDGKSILRAVNLRVAAGECVALVGPSGHGKTVLLKTLAGLIHPQEGEVLVKGTSWRQLDSARRLEILRTFGMLFQKNALFDSLTCGENVAFPLRETTNLGVADVSAMVERYLEAVGIPHARDLFPDEISGGMQKRLGIARALALRPEVVLYDDPTAGLDPITSRKIIELILQARRDSGGTVVAITNDMNRAFQMADRIVMVVDGEALITGSPAETRAHQDARVRQFIHGCAEGPLTTLA